MIFNSFNSQKLRKEYQEKKIIKIDNFLDKKIALLLYESLLRLDQDNLWFRANFGNPGYFKPGLPEHESIEKHLSWQFSIYPMTNISYSDLDKIGASRPGSEEDFSSELSETNQLKKISNIFNSSRFLKIISEMTNPELCLSKSISYLRSFTHEDYQAVAKSFFSPEVKINFLLNLTGIWQMNWGAACFLMNSEYNKILHSFIPDFNSLILYDAGLVTGFMPVSPYSQSRVYNFSGSFL